MATRQSKINIKAILLGALVDIGGTFLVSIVVGVLLLIVLTVQGTSPDELDSIANQLDRSFHFLAIIIGLGFTFLGGFTAARIAKTLEVTHAGIVGAICIFAGLLFARGFPLWFNVVAFLLTVPASILGGYVAKR